MMRELMAIMVFALALPAHAADNWWSDLWHNADQRGEAMLQHGDAANAAKVYKDPRRRAYAKLMSGDYATAAQDLKAFDDGDAHYNRGNALAHAGDLQGAIDAYDAALKHDPNNKDARHNREIVANALKQQQNKNATNKQSQDNKSGGKNSDGKGDSKNSSPSSRDGKGGKSDNADKGSDGTNRNNGAKDNQGGQGQQKSSSGGNDKNKAQGNTPQQSGSTGNAAAQEQKDSAEQARRDAAASLGSSNDDTQKNAANGANAAAAGDANGTLGNGTLPRAASSEKQLAQDQWLRSIPDDPGGLLRRKFLIEHMMRQQKAQQ